MRLRDKEESRRGNMDRRQLRQREEETIQGGVRRKKGDKEEKKEGKEARRAKRERRPSPFSLCSCRRSTFSLLAGNFSC